MSNYFDNQNVWAWAVEDGKVHVMTDHGDHTHTLDITDAPIGKMATDSGKVMGDAHRAAPHDFKAEGKGRTAMMREQENFRERIKCDHEVVEKTNKAGRSFSETPVRTRANSGRERGDEGEARGRTGREPGYKVADLRADMKATASNVSVSNGKSSHAGHGLNPSSKSAASSAKGISSAASGGSNGPAGHGNVGSHTSSGGAGSPGGHSGITGGGNGGCNGGHDHGGRGGH